MGIPSLGICSAMHYKFVPDNHLARNGPARWYNITWKTNPLIVAYNIIENTVVSMLKLNFEINAMVEFIYFMKRKDCKRFYLIVSKF